MRDKYGFENESETNAPQVGFRGGGSRSCRLKDLRSYSTHKGGLDGGSISET